MKTFSLSLIQNVILQVQILWKIIIDRAIDRQTHGQTDGQKQKMEGYDLILWTLNKKQRKYFLSVSLSLFEGWSNKLCYFRSTKFQIKHNPHQSVPYKSNLFIY